MPIKIKILLLIILSLVSSWRLFRPGYPSMQDDIQVFRLEQFDQCLSDRQIPCRYISNGGFGYGYPLYNFYSPLPYAVAETFHLIGFSFVNSIKISFIIPAFLRTFGMYFFAASFFGSSGGFLAALLYSLAPYQAINTFVRGAIGETWALALLPFIFWSLSQKRGKLSVLLLSSLLLSHNLTLIYALPLLALFTLITKNFKYFLRTILWSILLCAFFLFPAFFEKNLTTVNTMTEGYFSYIIHFATLKELFISRYWGYSGSMWGPLDGLSFQIGLTQYAVPVSVFILTLLKRNTKHRFLIMFFSLIALISLFLTHSKSTFIWQLFPFMAYFQFPWRFLGLSIFCLSFVSGGLVAFIKSNLKIPVVIGLIFTTIALNYPYFREDLWYSNLTDSDKLGGSELVRQSAAGLKDYWPKYSQNFPESFAPPAPIVLEGEVDFIKYYKNSHHATAYFSVSSDQALFNLPIVYFPNWELKIDNQKTDYQIDKNLGLIQISASQGQHSLSLDFKNTPLRTFSNILSLLAIGSFIILIIREKRS